MLNSLCCPQCGFPWSPLEQLGVFVFSSIPFYPEVERAKLSVGQVHVSCFGSVALPICFELLRTFFINLVEPESTSPLNLYGSLYLFLKLYLCILIFVRALYLLSRSLPSNRRDRHVTKNHRTQRVRVRDVYTVLGKQRRKWPADLEIVS